MVNEFRKNFVSNYINENVKNPRRVNIDSCATQKSKNVATNLSLSENNKDVIIENDVSYVLVDDLRLLA